MKKDSLVGVLLILFGVLVGGVGVATAGIGIGIPVIPIGLYLIWRGYVRQHDERVSRDSLGFEKSAKGKVGLGIILMLTGVATSAMIVGVPVFAYGAYLTYRGVWRQ